MAKNRTHSIDFKRQVAQDDLAGEPLRSLARRHDLSRNDPDLGSEGRGRCP
jgi:transposase